MTTQRCSPPKKSWFHGAPAHQSASVWIDGAGSRISNAEIRKRNLPRARNGSAPYRVVSRRKEEPIHGT
jgi:hypothetical protein